MAIHDYTDEKNVNDFNGVPAGTYSCMIQSPVRRIAKDSNNIVFDLHHLIIDGPFEGKTIEDSVTFTPNTGPIFKALYAACGLPVNSVDDGDASPLEGRPLLVDVIVQWSKKNEHGKWDTVNIPSDADLDVVNETALKEGARLRNIVSYGGYHLPADGTPSAEGTQL